MVLSVGEVWTRDSRVTPTSLDRLCESTGEGQREFGKLRRGDSGHGPRR